MRWGGPDSWWSGNVGGEMSDGVISGSGAYNIGKPVKKNSLMKHVTIAGDVPSVANVGKGEATVVRHREFIKNIKSGSFAAGTTSTVFTIESVRINPGNKSFGPWLANVALNYQEYRLTGCLVELKTISSELSTTLSLGSVMMATDYNVYAIPPPDKTHLENMEYSTDAKPSLSSLMPIECERKFDADTHLYIAANSTEVEGADQRLYDMGSVHIASEGIPAENADISELWVTYEVLLYKPRISDGLGVTPTFYAIGTGYTQGVQPLGTAVRHNYKNNTPLVVLDQGTNNVNVPCTISFINNVNPQAWFITLVWSGTAATGALVVPDVSVVNGVLDDTGGDNVYYNAPQAGVLTAQSVSLQFAVTTNGGSQPCIVTVLKNGVLPNSGPPYCAIFVTACNAALLAEVDASFLKVKERTDLIEEAAKAATDSDVIRNLQKQLSELTRYVGGMSRDNRPKSTEYPSLTTTTTPSTEYVPVFQAQGKEFPDDLNSFIRNEPFYHKS